MNKDPELKENINIESTITNPYRKKQTTGSETLSDRDIDFIGPEGIRPTSREMISLLKLRRIQWYGWNGQPKNISLVRDYFKWELRILCEQHGTILSDGEVTEVVETFYQIMGW